MFLSFFLFFSFRGFDFWFSFLLFLFFFLTFCGRCILVPPFGLPHPLLPWRGPWARSGAQEARYARVSSHVIFGGPNCDLFDYYGAAIVAVLFVQMVGGGKRWLSGVAGEGICVDKWAVSCPVPRSPPPPQSLRMKCIRGIVCSKLRCCLGSEVSPMCLFVWRFSARSSKEKGPNDGCRGE